MLALNVGAGESLRVTLAPNKKILISDESLRLLR